MPNILTVDDATFAGGTGNWTPQVALPITALSTATTPASPDGNNICRLQNTGSGTFAGAEIPRGIYPVAVGDAVSMEVNFSVPATNTGTGLLFCRIAVIIYETNPAVAGVEQAFATSAPFNPGDGWHHLVIPEFAVGTVAGAPPVGVGIQVTFGDWSGAGAGILTGDYAYFSDVELNGAAVGGWGVGMVRMGA